MGVACNETFAMKNLLKILLLRRNVNCKKDKENEELMREKNSENIQSK